jgi:hypothetical protein
VRHPFILGSWHAVVFDGGLDADQLTDGDQRTAPTLDAQDHADDRDPSG